MQLFEQCFWKDLEKCWEFSKIIDFGVMLRENCLSLLAREVNKYIAAMFKLNSYEIVTTLSDTNLHLSHTTAPSNNE